ncbi:hypothetical protein [Streptomyces dysideae]|uniref:hypothetical protein n=1 Tax=Streptomyces dysideae TaxID=909626 RepID=UPI000A81E584
MTRTAETLEREAPGVRASWRPAGHVLLRAGRGSFLLHRRALVVGDVLVVLLCADVVASLCIGQSFVAPDEVVRVLLGLPSSHELVVARSGCRVWCPACWWASPSASPAR